MFFSFTGADHFSSLFLVPSGRLIENAFNKEYGLPGPKKKRVSRRLGCSADDFTGATGLASMLRREGLNVGLTDGLVPQ